MSAAEFQKRLADLKFSASEVIKTLKAEQENSEEAHAEWEDDRDNFEPGDEEGGEFTDPEPDVIDHSVKIAHIETAIEHVEAAIDELNGALDE